MKKHPDALLYLHTDMFGAYGWRLADLLTSCGVPAENVLFCDQLQYRYGYPQEVLAALYTAMDVYLGISYGEGFGVGTIEAQACGVPVIVSDICASSELVGDGWAVECQPLWDDAQKSWFSVPSIPQTVEALMQAYARGRGQSVKALEFAVSLEQLHNFVFDFLLWGICHAASMGGRVNNVNHFFEAKKSPALGEA